MTLGPDAWAEETGGGGGPGAAGRRVDAPPDPRYLLTVEQAAKSLSLSRTRVYGLINAGQLLGVKIGRSTRIPLKSIEDLIDRLMNNPELLSRF